MEEFHFNMNFRILDVDALKKLTFANGEISFSIFILYTFIHFTTGTMKNRAMMKFLNDTFVHTKNEFLLI